MNFAKFLRTLFLQNTSGRLLLNVFKLRKNDDAELNFLTVVPILKPLNGGGQINLIVCDDINLLAETKLKDPATLSEKRNRHRYFKVNFVRFLRTALCKISGNGCFWTSRGVLRY